MVVDDHDILRAGVTISLSSFPDMGVNGEASDGTEAIERCEQLSPDVILLDMKMPGLDGLSTIPILRKRFPAVQIIVLTSYQEKELVQGAISSGAISYLLKDVSARELAEAVRRAYTGKPTLAPEAAQALIYAMQYPGRDREKLTLREKEVLHLMVKGFSNAEIANQLMISYSTSKKHVSNILTKLQTATRTEAVAIALQQNLVESD